MRLPDCRMLGVAYQAQSVLSEETRQSIVADSRGIKAADPGPASILGRHRGPQPRVLDPALEQGQFAVVTRRHARDHLDGPQLGSQTQILIRKRLHHQSNFHRIHLAANEARPSPPLRKTATSWN
jgi:hypothetical protein